jgi:DNA-binding IclR family transcriptional regulator
LQNTLLHRDERCINREINLKLEDIAASVGLRPETVSRILSAFEREELVKRLGRGRLKVIDRPGLETIGLEQS